MTKKDYKNFRSVVGEFLNTRREELGMTMYELKKKTGLSDAQAKAVLNGDGYHIDSLFACVEALDAYFYFAARDNTSGKMDENDFFRKMRDADPEK